MDLQDMKGALIILVLVAMVGSAGVIGLSALGEDIADDAPTTTVLNETVTWVNGTYVALAHPGWAALTCTVVTNDTVVVPLNTDVYTCTRGRGINLTDNHANVTANVNVSYTFSDGDVAYNITTEGRSGVSNTTNYLGTIGTIIGVAVLIGIVVLAFTFVRK